LRRRRMAGVGGWLRWMAGVGCNGTGEIAERDAQNGNEARRSNEVAEQAAADAAFGTDLT